MSDTKDLVLRSDAESVATLTLNRPERKNAWNPDLEARYYERLDEVDKDPDVRVIVVTGSGTTFCPGVDTQRLTSITTAEAPRINLDGRPAMSYPLTIRKPMIAAINGSAAGVGLMQILNCDVRFASSRAKFSTAFAKRGLPAEYNAAWILPRIIGVENALDLMLSSRVIDATEAKALGLISRILEPDEVLPAAQAYAAEMARLCSPRSLAAIRRQVYTGLSQNFSDAWTTAYALMADFTGREDFKEGVASYVEKRDVNFPPLDNNFRVPGDMGY
jgi:enoyl-CoA hydratase/carnithine racemase